MNLRNMMATTLLMSGFLLAACAPSSTLNNTNWQLVSLGSQPIDNTVQITLNYGDGKIYGTDGCNQYSASYTLDGNRIKINDDMASTLMACAEPVMQQADAFTSALAMVAAYKVEGKQLMLMSAEGITLATFKAQSLDLSGTAWIVTGYNNGKEAVVSVISGSELTASFGADGKLTGSAGCNTYVTTYELQAKRVTIKPAATTRKMCVTPEGIMEQETQFIKALGTAASFNIDGDRLEIRSDDGALAVALVQVR
jgi:heat shock protein HslJ